MKEDYILSSEEKNMLIKMVDYIARCKESMAPSSGYRWFNVDEACDLDSKSLEELNWRIKRLSQRCHYCGQIMPEVR